MTGTWFGVVIVGFLLALSIIGAYSRGRTAESLTRLTSNNLRR